MRRDSPCSSRFAVLLVVAVAAVAAVAGTPTGATATVTGVTPSTIRLAPGESRSVQVRGYSDTQECGLTASSDHPSVSASVDECVSGFDWTNNMLVSASADAPPGTRHVTVRQGGGSAVLTVEMPAPPPPPTTTTSAPARTSTTTTSAPVRTTTTTAAPPTTTAPTTTAAAAVLAGGSDGAAGAAGAARPFLRLPELATVPLPEQGIFLPLIGSSYEHCFPPDGTCRDDDSALALIRADTTDVTWTVAEGPPALPDLSLPGVPLLAPVGPQPLEAARLDYLLPVLDLADRGQMKGLRRGIATDQTLVGPSGRPIAVMSVPGDDALVAGATAFVSSRPFREPRTVRAADLSNPTPVLPLFLGTRVDVVYVVRADPDWRIAGSGPGLIPLLGVGSLPHYAHDATGAPGLYVPAVAGLDVRAAPEPVTAAAAPAAPSSSGGSFVVVAVVVIAAAGAALTTALVVTRRRRA